MVALFLVCGQGNANSPTLQPVWVCTQPLAVSKKRIRAMRMGYKKYFIGELALQM